MKREDWTAAEVAVLRARYADTRTEVLAGKLGRSVYAVYRRALMEGVRKTREHKRARRGFGFVGDERWQKGYLERKVADCTAEHSGWVTVHVLLWREAHGPVPAGHRVCFRDGDRTNITLGNLELVSFAETMRRNSIHNLSPELFGAIHLLGQFKRRIRRLDAKQN